MATRSSRSPFGGRRRRALIQLSGFGEPLRESLEEVDVGSSVGSTRLGLAKLPANYGETLHAYGVRDFLLRKARREAQLSAHARWREDVGQQGVHTLQGVRVSHTPTFHDR